MVLIFKYVYYIYFIWTVPDTYDRKTCITSIYLFTKFSLISIDFLLVQWLLVFPLDISYHYRLHWHPFCCALKYHFFTLGCKNRPPFYFGSRNRKPRVALSNLTLCVTGRTRCGQVWFCCSYLEQSHLSRSALPFGFRKLTWNSLSSLLLMESLAADT